MRRIVVVGAGLAGHRSALALRDLGFTGEVVVVGEEAHRPYDRPPLSKQILGGNWTAEQCFFDTGGLEVSWRLGVPAASLRTQQQTLVLADGTEIGYDGLVIATGRRARGWGGAVPSSGISTLRSLEDSRALRAAAGPGTRVVIIGAGFIGCEVAATLRGAGVEQVSVVDVATHPMPVLGAEVGARAARLHRAHGVDLRLSTGVSAIEGDAEGAVRRVLLADGSRLDADVVLIATGSEPASEWLRGSGVALDAGTVVCDARCAVLDSQGAIVPDVVAAGDIAARPHPHAVAPAAIEHWSNARDTATIAAATLLGVESATPLALVPTFWSDQYDVKIKSAGYLRAAEEFSVISEDPAKLSLVVEARRGGDVVGAIVWNMNRTYIGYLRSLTASLAGELARTPA